MAEAWFRVMVLAEEDKVLGFIVWMVDSGFRGNGGWLSRAVVYDLGFGRQKQVLGLRIQDSWTADPGFRIKWVAEHNQGGGLFVWATEARFRVQGLPEQN